MATSSEIQLLIDSLKSAVNGSAYSEGFKQSFLTVLNRTISGAGNGITSIRVITESATLALTDAGKDIEINSASANNITVPLNSSVAFDIGTNIYVTQMGAGLTTIVATGGVTINSSSGGLTSPGRYTTMILRKTDTNTWLLLNGLATGEWVTVSSPSWGGFSVAPVGTMKYVKIGKMVTLTWRSTTPGTSDATSKTLVLPFAAAAFQSCLITSVQNNGTYSNTPGNAYTVPSSTTLNIYRDVTAATWTASNGCTFDFTLIYESTT